MYDYTICVTGGIRTLMTKAVSDGILRIAHDYSADLFFRLHMNDLLLSTHLHTQGYADKVSQCNMPTKTRLNISHVGHFLVLFMYLAKEFYKVARSCAF